MTRKLSIHLDVELPEGFRISVYESCRNDDKETYCVGLTREIGHKRSHHTGFSSEAFDDAFGKAVAEFETGNTKRYWGDDFVVPTLVAQEVRDATS